MEPPSKPLADPSGAKSEYQSPGQRIGLGSLVLVAIGSLLAIPGACFDMLTTGGGFLGPIVAGPLIEESLKPMGLVVLLTRRPELKLNATAGLLVGAFSGLTFAVIENLIYLKVYFPDSDVHFVVWRWTVCVGVHMGCSSLVGYGLALSSGRATTEREEFRLLSSASPHLLDQPREQSGVFQGASFTYLVVAAALHGMYNFLAIALELGR